MSADFEPTAEEAAVIDGYLRAHMHERDALRNALAALLAAVKAYRALAPAKRWGEAEDTLVRAQVRAQVLLEPWPARERARREGLR